MSIYLTRMTGRASTRLQQPTGRPLYFCLLIIRRTLTEQRMNLTHYEALGVNSSASAKEIKAAFYKLSKQHHPDVNPDDRDAAKKFSVISNAYDILGDPIKRRDYDNELSSRSSNSDPYVTYDRTSSYAQRARAHRPSAWKPPSSSRNSSSGGGFPGSESAFGNSQYGTFDKDQYDAAFGRYRGPTPKGRTNIYDFDEFYRAHYSEFQFWSTARKEAEQKARQTRQDEEEKRRQRANRSTSSKLGIVAVWFSLATVVIILSNVLHDMHFQRPSEEFRAKFYLVEKTSSTKSPSEKS